MSNLYAVPKDIHRKGIANFVFKKNTTKCWYSGMPTVIVRIVEGMFEKQNFFYAMLPNIATKEHIFSNNKMLDMHEVVRARINNRFNLVPACRFINNSIGDAPIPVKLEIREALHKICANRIEFDNELMKQIKHCIDTIKAYYVDSNGNFFDYLYEEENRIFKSWNEYFTNENWMEIYNV